MQVLISKFTVDRTANLFCFKKSGPSNHNLRVSGFLTPSGRDATSAGFKFVGQYGQSSDFDSKQIFSMRREINLSKRKSLFFIHCNTLLESDQKYCLQSGNPNATNAFLDNSAVVTAATNFLRAIGQSSIQWVKS